MFLVGSGTGADFSGVFQWGMCAPLHPPLVSMDLRLQFYMLVEKLYMTTPCQMVVSTTWTGVALWQYVDSHADIL